MPENTPIDLSSARAAAEAALGDRLAHIDTIVGVQNKRVAAAEDVAAARAAEVELAAAEKQAIRAALAGGWTVAELRSVGLSVPDTLGRSASKRTRRIKSPAATAAKAPELLHADAAAGTSA